jgi:photosystem II stability/assembly factor-like uncharacterized protein
MKTHLIRSGIAVAILVAIGIGYFTKHSNTIESEEKEGTLLGRVQGRFQQEWLMTRDPKSNIIPRDRLLTAYQIAETKRLEKDNALPIYWEERGPNNVGGRTRGLIFDANDASGRTVWAAGVAGGLWRTTNIDAPAPTWNLINDFFPNLAITTIVQDPSNANVMYFGTGEEGVGAGDAVRGLGIWRSSDGGATWNQLGTTAGFQVINKMVVDNAGIVYAATNQGIRRSTDGGNTWNLVAANNRNVQDIDIAANGDIFAAANGLGIFRFRNNAWTQLTTDLPTTNLARIEIACAPGNANVLYAAYADTIAGGQSACNRLFQSTNGGDNWTLRTTPAGLGVFCWYALTLGVDPNDANRLWIGDIALFVSGDAGANWTQISNIHADQHIVVYRPGNSDEVIIGNDGGVYRSTNGSAGTPTVTPRNNGYNVTQFYTNALHPTLGSNYFLGGTQDNGTQRFNNPGLSSTDEPTGNDGAFCFIDQDNPNIQITGSQNRLFFISTDGGMNFNTLMSGKNSALFITPADYDDDADVFYFSDSVNILGRVTGVGAANTITLETIAGIGGRASAITVSPNTANRVFVGSTSGRLLRVDNAHQNGMVTATAIGAPANGFVSCIAVETGNDNHLLVTYSNYGINSVWESTDGGTTWTSIEGDLPDMPVRWAMFNPFNSDQALLATELGVWSSRDLSGGTTDWDPTSYFGLANVRVDMFQYRPSDHLVIAATHGRGMYSTDYFTLAGDCPMTENITGAIPSGIYVAEDFVESDGTIAAGTKTIFQAGNYVELNPGFEAARGSDFWALILGCNFDPMPLVDNPVEKVRDFEMQLTAPLVTQLKCYPNPARDAATIRYTVPTESPVTIEVVDGQGRLVKRLVNNQLQSPGVYNLDLRSGDWSNGFYLIVFRAGTAGLTEQFFVVK